MTTPQQDAIQEAAESLLSNLDAYVPSSTVHYAVQEARRALRTLIRENATRPIVTEDYNRYLSIEKGYNPYEDAGKTTTTQRSSRAKPEQHAGWTFRSDTLLDPGMPPMED